MARNESAISRLALAVTLLFGSLLYWSLDGLRYDDSFIFLRIAQNMMGGHGPVWNVGDHFTNSTSALWPALIAIGGIFAGHDGLPALSKILSYLCLCGSSVALYGIIRRSLYKHQAWVAPLAVFLPAHHFVLAGMESELALFALLTTLLLYISDISLYYVAIALAALYLARPDGVLFAGLLVADYLFFGFSKRQREPALMGRLSAAIMPALLCIGLCLIWHGYLLFYTGSFLPMTLHAKIIQGTSRTYWDPFGADILLNLRAAASGSRFFLALAVLGLFSLLRIAPIIPVWVAFHLAAYAAAGIAAYTWYYYPMFFALCLSAFLGIAQLFEWALALLRRLAPDSPARVAGTVFLVPVTLLLLTQAAATQMGLTTLGLIHWAQHLRLHLNNDLNVNRNALYDDSRRQAHDQIADWIISNRPNSQGTTVLTDEIGVIGYRLADWRVVDEVGMTDPDFSVGLIHNWPYYVLHNHPQFIIRNYIHSQPDIMSFPFDATHYGVYQKVFEANTFFISVLYELKFVYAGNLSFLDGLTPICRVDVSKNDQDSPGFDGLTVYRLGFGKDVYALVSDVSLPANGYYSGASNFHFSLNGKDVISGGAKIFDPTVVVQSGNNVKLVTITTLAPGHYNGIFTITGAPSLIAGPEKISAISFDVTK